MKFSGVLAPVLTPFKADLSPDASAFAKHCSWLLDQGVDGLAVFGTTSEANSLSVEEKIDLLDALLEDGVPPDKLMPGTGTCALTDTVRLTRHAVQRGCGGVLMLPPFYYKAINDQGLFAAFSETIERVGDDRLRVYLYHIPPVSQIAVSLDLVERLLTAYPDTVAGLKDSSGDWSNTEAVLRRFPGFGTFAGSEVFLLSTLRGGGAGCITATGNVNPAGIRKLYEQWQTPDADALQTRITEIRNTIQSHPMIPALKVIASDYYSEPAWSTVRPPLVALDDVSVKSLMGSLRSAGFNMATNRDSVGIAKVFA